MAIFLKIITCVIFDGLFLCICPKFRLYFGKFLSYWENIIFFVNGYILTKTSVSVTRLDYFRKILATIFLLKEA